MPELHRLKAFFDNYIWALCDPQGHCLVVDPGDAAPVEDFLARGGYSLDAVLVTHHHPDHIGGLAQLTANRDIPVYGPAFEAIPGVNQKVCDGDDLLLAAPSAHLRVLEVPGHTLGHVAYVTVGEDPPLLFCGDTLFAGGCGRLFEGTPAQMQSSLDRLAALPDATRVCCAHEYTLSNLGFASAVLPDDPAVRDRYRHVRDRRERGEATVPAVLEEERATNPFLRVDEPELRAALERHAGRALPERTERFAVLRSWKDGF